MSNSAWDASALTEDDFDDRDDYAIFTLSLLLEGVAKSAGLDWKPEIIYEVLHTYLGEESALLIEKDEVQSCLMDLAVAHNEPGGLTALRSKHGRH